ncbi:MAG TPA: transposase [Thermoanaerobaculia bacterium]
MITELGRLIVSFRRAEPTPRAGHRFEARLQELLRELGRVIVEWTFNHLEPHDPKDLPGQIESGGTRYRRRGKTPNRKVATLFGTITLWRTLYQDVHGVEPAIFPLEIRLGLESGRATPALAERAARAAVTSPQDAVLTALRDENGVRWSVASLRAVIADVAAGMGAHRQDAQVDRLLGWLEQADRSSGARKPVLAVGRDGLMLPIRGQGCHREGAAATVSVYDRKGRRLGTVYLGRMPEPGQGALSRRLTALIEAMLGGWTGPPPRLAYITDGGTHQARYYRRVLQRMSDPHHPGRRLRWRWVIDCYHACEYITTLSEALFSDARAGASWARKMRRWLKEKPRGIYRVLHSAAAIRRRRIIASAAKREQYRTAYAYLRKRTRRLDYVGYRRDHLPIGSGVTEAACKTVFTQRMKQSGMTWKAESGQWIVDLRVIHLSGVWSEVYQSYLESKEKDGMGTQGTTPMRKASKAA